MSRQKLRVPKYRHHKARNLARVNIDGKDVYLGPYDSPESHRRYDQVIAEWLLTRDDPQSTATESLTVCELMVLYLRFAKKYYVKNGDVTSELACIKAALRPLRRLHETTAVSEFGPKALKSVQEWMIQEGASRTYINSQIKRIQRMFKWGASEELVPSHVYQAVATVSGLRKGRTVAKERPPVQPVPDNVIDQTLPHVPPVIADMIRLQRLTGARPGEVVCLRPSDIDQSSEVWEYHPGTHKTEHHHKQRVIYFGPKAQAILQTYLNRPDHCHCFSPAESESRRLDLNHQQRRTPPNQGNRRTTKRSRRKRSPGDRYSTESYRRAIHRACDKIRIGRWSPNRIRHTTATDIRKQFGLEAAQTVLGHSNAAITQIYAERDMELASNVAREIG